MKKTVCLVMVVLFGFTMGCTPAEFKQKAKETVQSTIGVFSGQKTAEDNEGNSQVKDATVEGAAIGAAVGGGGAILIGKDSKTALVAGAAGAVIGGVISYSLAKRLENEKKELEKEGNDLDAQINYAKAVNENADEYNKKLSDQIKTIEADLKSGKVTKAELAELNSSIAENEKTLVSEISDLKEYQKTLSSENHPQQKVDDLDNQIGMLETQLDSLKQSSETIAERSRLKT